LFIGMMMTSSVLTVFPVRFSNLSRNQKSSISLHINTYQVQPILDGDVDMTVLEHHFYLQAATKEFYTVKRASRLDTYLFYLFYLNLKSQLGSPFRYLRFPPSNLY